MTVSSVKPALQPASQSLAFLLRLLRLLRLFCLLRLLCSSVLAKDKSSELLNGLLTDYDSRLSPSLFSENPTVVECDIQMTSFDSISESTMDYVVTIFLRQKWIDLRLSFQNSGLTGADVVSLDTKMADLLWIPDLFFSNEKHAYFHEVTVPNRFVRLYRNGTVYYSVRVSLRLSCLMTLHKFPLDKQVCSMQLESYAYTVSDVKFKWKGKNPIQSDKEMELPQFNLDAIVTSDCTKNYSTGSFPCLQLSFHLTRDVGFYMIQTYIPSGLIVMLSWVSFWINVDAIPARISLGVLTILTMTTQSSGSRQNLPRVSYIKAIDVWMAVCLLFVFLALLEFAIINVLSRKEVRRMVTIRRSQQSKRVPGETGRLPDCLEVNKSEFEMDDIDGVSREERFVRDPFGRRRARSADKLARKLFPTTFVLFNVIYWTTYLYWEPQNEHQ